MATQRASGSRSSGVSRRGAERKINVPPSGFTMEKRPGNASRKKAAASRSIVSTLRHGLEAQRLERRVAELQQTPAWIVQIDRHPQSEQAACDCKIEEHVHQGF